MPGLGPSMFLQPAMAMLRPHWLHLFAYNGADCRLWAVRNVATVACACVRAAGAAVPAAISFASSSATRLALKSAYERKATAASVASYWLAVGSTACFLTRSGYVAMAALKSASYEAFGIVVA